MRKRILPIVCFAALCFVLLCPLWAHAAPLDPGAEASLALRYQKENTPFPGLNISIYRVAEAAADGTFDLISPYAGYPVNIHGITEQAQWQQQAATIGAYIVADGLTADGQAVTDETGTARFAGLSTGLYYVEQVIARRQDGTYVFDRFFVYLPTPQADGSYNYHVDAKPKCSEFIPNTEYTVTKLWKDDGTGNRPKEVTVEIYRDGALYETQTLSAENHWTYTWYVSSEDQSQWTVAEKPVPTGYRVTIRQNGNHFTVINSGKTQPETPQTGDTFSPLPWILALCFSGIMLLILGLYRRRQR